jgi:predicted porin
MDYQLNGTSGTTATAAVANATRTANVIKWDSPNWGGFQLTAAYSTSPLAASSEGDMSASAAGTKTDGGEGINLAAKFTGANWQIGASMWDAKAEAGTAATSPWEQSSQAVWGYIRFGGFKVGAAMNQATLTNNLGVDVSDRMSMTVPVSYTTGPHGFYLTYTMADDDDAMPGLSTAATMISAAYSYDLSKRTSVAVTYSAIDNDTNANYNFFTGASLGSADASPQRGEDLSLIQLTLRHTF